MDAGMSDAAGEQPAAAPADTPNFAVFDSDPAAMGGLPPEQRDAIRADDDVNPIQDSPHMLWCGEAAFLQPTFGPNRLGPFAVVVDSLQPTKDANGNDTVQLHCFLHGDEKKPIILQGFPATEFLVDGENPSLGSYDLSAPDSWPCGFDRQLLDAATQKKAVWWDKFTEDDDVRQNEGFKPDKCHLEVSGHLVSGARPNQPPILDECRIIGVLPWYFDARKCGQIVNTLANGNPFWLAKHMADAQPGSISSLFGIGGRRAQEVKNYVSEQLTKRHPIGDFKSYGHLQEAYTAAGKANFLPAVGA